MFRTAHDNARAILISLVFGGFLMACGADSAGTGQTPCLNDQDCPQGFHCGENLLCVSNGDGTEECTSTDQCPVGEVCNLETRLCEAPSDGDSDGAADGDPELLPCEGNSDCPSNYVCDDDSHTCVAQPTDGDITDNPEEDQDITEGDAPDSETADGDGEGAPRLQVPAVLEFSPLALDETADQTLVLQSVGDTALNIKSIALESAPTDYLLPNAPSSPVLVPPGDDFELTVRYMQSNTGMDSNAILIETNDPLQPTTRVTVQSLAKGAPVIECDVEALDFGVIDVSGELGEKVVSCTNKKTGETDDNILIISSLTIEQNGSLFFLKSTVPNQVYIHSGVTSAIPVQFNPATEVTSDATLKIYHNSQSSPSPVLVSLTGAGGARHLAVNPTSHSFGAVRIGGEPAIQEFTLTSTGHFPVEVNSIAKGLGCSTDFALDVTEIGVFPSTIDGATESLSFTVSFSPTIVTSQTCHIDISSNALESSISLAIGGSGTNFNLTSDPPSLQFGPVEVGQPKTLSFTLRNGGNASLDIQSVALTDENGVFGTISPDGFTLDAFSGLTPTRTFEITFTPAEEIPDYQGTIRFNIDDADNPTFDVPLSGRGALAHFSIAPEETLHDFGETNIGETVNLTYSISNGGHIPLILSNPQFVGEPFETDPYGAISYIWPDPASIPASSSANLTIRFAPPTAIVGTLPQQVSRTFSFDTNDLEHPTLTLDFTGTIVDPHVVLDPSGSTYDFGSRFPGYEATPIAVKLTNGGSGTLVINNIALLNGSTSNYLFSLTEAPAAFPVVLSPATTKEGEVAELNFVVHYKPLAFGSHSATLRIDNEGFENPSLEISLIGQGSQCPANTHDCSGECVDSLDPDHCGSRCSPCPLPEYAAGATCSSSYDCGFTCEPNFNKVGSACVPVNTPTCCGPRCAQDCTLSVPSHGVGVCTSGQCGFTCESFYHPDGDHCALNDSPTCCGATCSPCAVRSHASPSCIEQACRWSCDELYGDCNNDLNNAGYSNGCETYLTSLYNCGVCDQKCLLNHAQESCSTGECIVTQCDFGYGNCDDDDSNGCETGTLTNSSHCGTCHHACTTPHGTGVCTNGTCQIQSCEEGYIDCNQSQLDGCEINYLTNPSNCGECRKKCELPNAENICVAGQCAIQSCAPGYKDCNTWLPDGCERNLMTDINHCGDCGLKCQPANATGYCLNGDCQIQACSGTYLNCNTDPDDGCEVDKSTNVNHCGACFRACEYDNASGQCQNSVCHMTTCDTGFRNCDNTDTNGCETDIYNDLDNCGGCEFGCDFKNASEYCSTGTCTFSQCDPGWRDCDDNLSFNGCEINTREDEDNCGACDQFCRPTHANGVCEDGTCQILSCYDGWEDCNEDPDDGCEINLFDDPDNCHTCGNICNLSHTDQHTCVSQTCQALTCDSGWGDCDGNPANGCETDVSSDTHNCGVCGNVCQLSQGSSVCTSGVCQSTCNNGWADCNGGSDGCEADLSFNKNGCSSAPAVSTTTGQEIRGDTGGDISNTYYDTQEKWFAAHIVEGNNSCVYLSAWVLLDVPPGLNYTLEIFKDGCDGSRYLGSGGTGQDEILKFCDDDKWGTDDTFWLYIHVNFDQGNTCTQWALTVLGNLAVDGCECVWF